MHINTKHRSDSLPPSTFYWEYDPLQAWTDFGYVNTSPTDSASAATAMSTGVKTYDAAIGVDVNGAPLTHFMQIAEQLGKATGVVTSVEAVTDWVRAHSNWGETIVIVTGDHECGYLTGPGSDPTWEPLVNYGPGVLPGMEWHSGNHTNSLIPFFAKGDAARLFKWAAVGDDPIRGEYLDNTAIGTLCFEILGKANPNRP